jgi:hypothetical protein
MLIDLLSNHELRRWIRTCYRFYKVEMTSSEVLGLLRWFLYHEDVKRWSLDTLGGKIAVRKCANGGARDRPHIAPCVKFQE